MKIRMCSVTEDQYQKCLANNVWGAHGIRIIQSWEIGDLLVFKIGDNLAAIAKINSKNYLDDKVIWDNGLFYDRVALKFEKILKGDKRIVFSGELKEAFIKKWGNRYGWVILNKFPLPNDIAQLILDKFDYK